MKKRDDLFVNLGLLLSVAVACFIILEILVRILGLAPVMGIPQHIIQLDDKLGYVLKPNFNGTMKSHEYEINVRTNSDGFRDEEWMDDDFVILAVGDSFQFGTGVPQDKIYVEQLEEKLDVTVYNAGVVGWGTRQEYLYAKNEGVRKEPDMIIVSYFIGNDAHDNYLFDSIEYSEYRGHLLYSKPTAGVKMKVLMAEYCKSCLLTYRMYKLQAGGSASAEGNVELRQFYPGWDEERAATWNATIAVLHDFEQLATDEDIPLVIVLLPHRLQTQSEQFEGMDPYIPQRLLAENLNSTLIDLYAEGLNNASYFYPIDGHFTEEGHAVAADIVARKIDSIVR